MPTAYGTPAGTLTRPDSQVGGDAYAGDSGSSGLNTNGPYSSGTYTLHVSVGNAVPEASELALMSLGLSGLLLYRRKKA
jgi:hypothetical protein